jgi:hypothetical protein
VVAILRPPSASLATDTELVAEQAARIAADEALDTALTQSIADEATARANADNALDNAKVAKADNGSDFADVAEVRDNLGLGDAATQDAMDLPVSTAQGVALALKAKKGIRRPESEVTGLGFPISTIDAPADGSNYAAFPGTCDTLDGEILVVWRVATHHNFSSVGQAGALYMARSSDGGQTFSARSIVQDERPTYDLRDPCLYRVSGESRIYLTYMKHLQGAVITPGIWLTYSDDDGDSWAEPINVRASAASGTAIRKTSAGWRWPIYESVSSEYRSRMLVASDPLGAWTLGTDAAVLVGVGASEWDFVEISAANWVGVVRPLTATQVRVIQSTNQGATWSAPTTLSSTPYLLNAWPTLYKTLDGNVLCFIRSVGQGLYFLNLVDQAAPLTAASWAHGFGSLAAGTGGGTAGKFIPVGVGSSIRGAYMAESAPDTVSAVYFGALNIRSLYAWSSNVAAAEKIPDGSALAFQSLTTPDRVTFWTPGGLHRITYTTQSSQASGTVSTWQTDIAVDGVLIGSSNQFYQEVGGVTTPVVNSAYPSSGRSGQRFLSRGTHTVDIKYRQNDTTVGRHHYRRTLTVELVP